jgi:hypothetical protein
VVVPELDPSTVTVDTCRPRGLMMWAADPVFISADDCAIAEVVKRATTVEERILIVYSRVEDVKV